MAVSFESLSFDPYKSREEILLNGSYDPDQNFFNEQKIETSYFTPIEAKEKLASGNRDKFSILHLNIRSMHKNFENFMSFLKSINHNSNVICLTET